MTRMPCDKAEVRGEHASVCRAQINILIQLPQINEYNAPRAATVETTDGENPTSFQWQPAYGAANQKTVTVQITTASRRNTVSSFDGV